MRRPAPARIVLTLVVVLMGTMLSPGLPRASAAPPTPTAERAAPTIERAAAPRVRRVVVAPRRKTIVAGRTTKVRAFAFLANGRKTIINKRARYAVSPTRIATVKGNTIRTKRAGTIQVRATFRGVRSKPVKVRVTPPVPVRLLVSPPATSVAIGTPGRLTATYVMSNQTRRTVTGSAAWTSSSPGVVTVAKGVLTGVAEGSATVTARLGGRAASARVTVTDESTPEPQPTALAVTPANPSVEQDTNAQLEATITFDDDSTASGTAVATWESSDPAVATVDTGLVQALEPGTVTITATSQGVSGQATLTVTEPPPPTPTSLSVSPPTASVRAGADTSLDASLLLSDGSSQGVTDTATWTSSDPAVATVAAGTVTGVAEGTVTITAETQGQSGTATVTVTPVPTDRMETALTDGDPNIVTRAELVAEARALLATRENGAGLLPESTPITWDPTRGSWRASALAAGYQVPLLRGNTNTYGSGPSQTLAAYGSSPSSATPLAYFALDPFAIESSGPQTDPGMNALLRNVLTEMLGEPVASTDAKITLANIRGGFEPQTRQWLATEAPQAAVTSANNACNFPMPAGCLEGTELLVVGGENVGSDLGGTVAERNTAAAALLKQAHDAGVPVLFFADSFDTPTPVSYFGDAFGMTIETQFFQVSALAGATRQQQLDDGLDQVGDDYTEVLDRTTTDPLAYADYGACVKPAGGNGDLQGWTWARCANQPAGTADGVQPFLDGLTRIKSQLESAVTPVPFTVRRTADQDLFRILLLLADKARTGDAFAEQPDEDAVAVTYPVPLDDPVQVARSLFADYVTSTTWSGNQLADDQGTLYCSRADLDADACEDPANVDVGEHTVTLSATAADEWKSTGLSLVPGAAGTVTLAGDPGFPVYVRSFYDKVQTSRAAELQNDGSSRYDRPQFVTTSWIRLLPGVATTISSSYGGPLYLRMGSSPATLGTEVTITAEDVGTHPTLLDANDDAQIDAFVAAMNAPERNYYTDLSVGVLEVHTPAAQLEASLSPYTETGRPVDYGGLPGLTDFLTDVRDAWVYTDLGLAGLKLPGQALADTIPAEVQTVCVDLGIPCLDADLNNRPQIQHANYGPFASCGALCSGNPLDSSGFPRATGFGENHELGHNLQRKQLDVHWVDTADGTNAGRTETWTDYIDRSGEVSNNIFPVYALTKYFRGVDDDPRTDRNLGGVRVHSVVQSLRSGITRNGQLAALEPSTNGATCTVLDSFPVGTPAATAIADALWSDGGYDQEGPERLNLYVNIAMLADGMQLADGTTLAEGWDIYTLLYAAARQFTKISANETAWNADRATMGFGTLPFTGEATYGGGNVGTMPGNDFLLVQLNRITGYDWAPFLSTHGVYTTTLAKQQAAANAPGGYDVLGDVTRVIDRQLPYSDLRDPRTPLLNLSNPATVWPGFDNNGDGDTADAADLAGFHPSSCPG